MYNREITRKARTAFVIAIDQSGSMAESVTVGRSHMTKAEAVAAITGRLIEELLLRANRDDGVRDYYDIAVIGYGNDSVYPLLGDKIGFMSITELPPLQRDVHVVTVERTLPSGERRVFAEMIPRWIIPRAEGSTPMYAALTATRRLVSEWCTAQRNCEGFPPTVFNITDGEATDGEEECLREAAARIRSMGTLDGEVLLINIHITSNPSLPSMIFPRRDEIAAGDRYARLLADISSVVPPCMNDAVRLFRGDFAQPPYLAMSYNASITEAVTMLNIGSRSAAVLH